MKKYLVVLASLLILLGFVGYGTVKAYAEENEGGYPPLVQKLAERFNLNEEEVKTVFDEMRGEREGLRRENREEGLNQAVANGVITEEQKQKLTDKWAEEMSQRQKHGEEMKVWFEEQGINPESLKQYGCMGGRGSGRGFKNQ